MPIRWATAADKDALLQLIENQASAKRAAQLQHLWHWQFQANPYLAQGGPQSLVLEVAGRVVGALLSFPLPMQICGQQVLSNCMIDFLVHPEHRGAGIGLALKMTRLPDYFWGAPNAGSLPLWRQLGSKDLCQLDVWCCITDLQAKLLGRGRSALLARAAGLAWRGVQLALRPFGHGRAGGVQISLIERFDPAFDALWQQARDSTTVSLVKDYRYLSWRFDQCPRHYTRFAAYRGKEVVGYVVCRLSEGGATGKGYVVDLLAARQDRQVAAQLLSTATHWLAAQGAHTVYCTGPRTVSPGGIFSLLRQGFVFRPWTVQMAGNPHFLEHHDQDELARSAWLFTKGDGELDFLADD